MNDDINKPKGVKVLNKSTGAREILQSLKQSELPARVRSGETSGTPRTFATADTQVSMPGETVSTVGEPTAERIAVKTKDQPKAECLADFLSFFYAGKTKSLGDTTLRKLVKNAGVAGARRYELLALAEENDPTLEKSLNLMLLAADLSGYRNIEEQLRFFAADIGRRVQGLGKRSLESWLPRTSDEGIDLEVMAVEAREAIQKVNASEAVSTEKKKAIKRLECGFYLACQWRIYQGLAPRSLVEVLRRRIFQPAELHQERGDGLIRLMISQPFSDAPGLAWLLDDQVRQIQLADTRADQLQRELRVMETAKSQVEEALKARDILLAEQEVQLYDLQAQLNTAKEQSRIQGVHSNDDLSRLRGQVLRLFDSELPVLQDVLTALDRDPPKIGVARGYLGSVVENLSKEITRIKG